MSRGHGLPTSLFAARPASSYDPPVMDQRCVGQAAEAQKCVGCGAGGATRWLDQVRDYISDEFFDIVRCKACGLRMTVPPPRELAPYYPQRYRSHRQRQTGHWRTRRRAHQIQRLFPCGFKGRLLDLGCGSGAFAMEMHKQGWRVAVTELDDAVLERMRGAGIESSRPEQAMSGGIAGPFDAITCWHVLEHVPDPLALVKWARSILSPGGYFLINVPNAGSWQAAMFGRHWMHLDVPRHLTHFDPPALGKLLDSAGLQIIGRSTLTIEYDVFGVIQSALNRICSRPNVLYERLTAIGAAPPAIKRDVALSYALSPVLGAAGLGQALLAGALGKGGSISIICRAR